MLNLDREGTIALRPGNEHHEPCAVFVGGINGFDMLILKKINASTILFGDPDGEDLMDMDFHALQVMELEWKIENTSRARARFEENLAELTEG
jgi:hypothetical protein